jgi:hypothetical protein
LAVGSNPTGPTGTRGNATNIVNLETNHLSGHPECGFCLNPPSLEGQEGNSLLDFPGG